MFQYNSLVKYGKYTYFIENGEKQNEISINEKFDLAGWIIFVLQLLFFYYLIYYKIHVFSGYLKAYRGRIEKKRAIMWKKKIAKK